MSSDVMHRHVTTLRTQEAPISCLAVHHTLLYAASVNIVNVYDASTYVHVDTFNAGDSSSGSVKSIAFDSTCVYTAHQDGKIRVWHVTATPPKRHRLVSTLPTVGDRIRRSIFPKNYTRVSRHEKRLWIEHCDAVSGLVVAGGYLYSVSWDKSLKIWDTTSSGRRCLESVTDHDDAVNAVAVSGDGDVYTGSADGCIRVWGRSSDKHVLFATLKKHKSAVNALALNGDGSVLFSGGGDRCVTVWEKKKMERERDRDRVVFVEALWGHTGAVLCLMNAGDWLVSGSSDRTVRVWGRGKCSGYDCRIVLGHERAVKSLVTVFGGYGNGVVSICSGSLDGEIKVWEVSCSNCNNKLSDKFQT